MSKPLIKCTRCNGTGSHPLSEQLAEVFALFKGARQFSAEEARDELGLEEVTTVGAMNNRLEDLRGAGLLNRTKKSRTYFYHIANHHKKKE